MAIDRYTRIADNLAAVAATLEYLRGVERHGGAAIMDRAFTGFAALPPPALAKAWHIALGVPAHTPTDQVREAYRTARSLTHPHRGGDAGAYDRVQRAWLAFCAERGETP